MKERKVLRKSSSEMKNFSLKLMTKRNKYLGEWAAEKLGKSDVDKEAYVQRSY